MKYEYCTILVLLTIVAGIQCQTASQCYDDFNMVCGVNMNGNHMAFDNECRLSAFNANLTEGESKYTKTELDACRLYDENLCMRIRCALPGAYDNSNSKPYMCITNGCVMFPVTSGCQFTVLNCGDRQRCGRFAFYSYGSCPRLIY